MASEEELKAMILSFRVSELHMLLGFAGRNKSGRKLELQARAIELLKLNSYPVILKIKNLYKSIQQGSHSNSGSANTGIQEANSSEMGSTESRNETNDQRSVVPARHVSYGRTLEKVSSSDVTRGCVHCAGRKNTGIVEHFRAPNPDTEMHASNYPVHPDVKFQRLPFYEITAELLKPSSLVPEIHSTIQQNTFVFHLTPQQSVAINLSRSVGAGGKAEYALQAQLRICLLETTCAQEDTFPPGLSLKINDKPCPLPNPVLNKLGEGPKRLSRPVNITPLMKVSPTFGNTIQIQWDNDYSKRYAIAVYLVKKKTSEALLRTMKAKGVRGADYTRGMIKDKLNEDADSEIATTSLRVSLVCPIGKMRMVNPCRASTCQHLQCFDASLFLQMNEKKPNWTCPVCDNPAPYEKLLIDGYFQEVLCSGKLPPEGNEIQLHSDGSWSALAKKKVCVRSTEREESNTDENCESVNLEGDELKAMAPSKIELTDDSTDNDKSGDRSVEEIDLTASDSDEEPVVVRKKKLDCFFKELDSFPGNSESSIPPESEIGSPKSSPNVIILDSDSSTVSVPLPSPSPSLSSSNELLTNDSLLPDPIDDIPPSCHSTSPILSNFEDL